MFRTGSFEAPQEGFWPFLPKRERDTFSPKQLRSRRHAPFTPRLQGLTQSLPWLKTAHHGRCRTKQIHRARSGLPSAAQEFNVGLLHVLKSS
jgi:hypothetical protein